jgi:hypothetical protein
MDLQFLATAKTEEMLQVVNAYYLHNSCRFAIVFIFFIYHTSVSNSQCYPL